MQNKNQIYLLSGLVAVALLAVGVMSYSGVDAKNAQVGARPTAQAADVVVEAAPVPTPPDQAESDTVPASKCPDGDSCIEINPHDPVEIASFFDETTLIGDLPAVFPTAGTDDMRGLYVANKIRPQVLGHDVNIIGDATLFNLGNGIMMPNYRENCNDLQANLPTNQQQMADMVAQHPSVAGVIGPVCSGSAGTPSLGSPFLSNNNIVAISPNSQSLELTSPTQLRPRNAFWFRTGPNGKYQGQVMAEWAKNVSNNFTRAATIDGNDAYSTGITSGFKTNFDDSTAGRRTVFQFHRLSNNDEIYKPAVLAPPTPETGFLVDVMAYNNANTQDIQLIYMTNTSLTQQAYFIKQAKILMAAGRLPSTTKLALGNAAQSKELWDGLTGFSGYVPLSAAEANEVLLTNTKWSDFTTRQAYVDFRIKFDGFFGKPRNSFHGATSDAYNMILDAIEKVAIHGSDNDSAQKFLIPRKALRDAVLNTNVAIGSPAGLFGAHVCKADGGALNVIDGDCSQGKGFYEVDTIACSDTTDKATCNFRNNPMP